MSCVWSHRPCTGMYRAPLSIIHEPNKVFSESDTCCIFSIIPTLHSVHCTYIQLHTIVDHLHSLFGCIHICCIMFTFFWGTSHCMHMHTSAYILHLPIWAHPVCARIASGNSIPPAGWEQGQASGRPVAARLCRWHRPETEMALPTAVRLGLFALVGVIGVTLGLLEHAYQPPTEGLRHCRESMSTVSSVIGWTYFMAWSLSFYPQFFLNFLRRSVSGCSLNFLLLNVVGFACYAVYNVAMFFSAEVRKEYRKANHGSRPLVRANDVLFALHALILTFMQGAQAVAYPRGGQRVSPFVQLALVAVGGVLAVLLNLVITGACAACTWLNLLYALSYIKLAISIIKYIPQVHLNWRRGSTVGWNIDNVLLDWTGGLLSVGQEFLDAGCSGDWSSSPALRSSSRSASHQWRSTLYSCSSTTCSFAAPTAHLTRSVASLRARHAQARRPTLCSAQAFLKCALTSKQTMSMTAHPKMSNALRRSSCEPRGKNPASSLSRKDTVEARMGTGTYESLEPPGQTFTRARAM